MHIETEQNRLVIRETPGCLWIFGLFFAVVGGIFVYGALGGLKDYGSQPPLMLAIALVMGAAGVAAGVWIVYRAPVTKIVVDRLDAEVTLTRYGLFGRQETVYAFDEIERFCLIEDRDDEGSPIWNFGMQLAGDEEFVKITSLSSHSEEYERGYVFQTNVFMNKQPPPVQMICGLADEDAGELG
ncbi:MAG: hypothetical protein JSS81_17570 [Acidobacteria bacterium]|nr:hypothetical protein [Acidobacteriota bacterium]